MSGSINHFYGSVNKCLLSAKLMALIVSALDHRLIVRKAGILSEDDKRGVERSVAKLLSKSGS